MQITITSWNVKGLRSPNKRSKILRHLKKLDTDVALLQETHLAEKDLNRLKKTWVGEVIGSTGTGKTAGVIILLNKRIPYNVTKIEREDDGRRISIVLTQRNDPRNRTMQITNLYAPNNPDKNYFRDLLTWYLQQNNDRHVIGGDMNMTVNNEIDRQRQKQKKDTTTKTRPYAPQETKQTMLSDFIKQANMVDTWRQQHPTDREYTFNSHVHKSLSRIDHILTTTALTLQIINTGIKPIAVSDHAPVRMTLRTQLKVNNTLGWRYPNHLTENLAIRKYVKERV